MKRLNFLPFLLCMLFAACVQKENYPSPLEGVHIDNQSFDSESSKLTLEVNSSLANVQAEVLDMETMDFADWLKVDVARQKLTLTITDNITAKERTARVTLYTFDRDDVDDNSLTVVFYVTQTKNTQFDGLEIEEVVVDHHRCDTVVVLEHVLRNVKATVTDLEGNKADWVKTTVGTNYLALAISEHVSKGERQALIRLQPSSKTQVADSLLPGTNFLITQRHNPVLDSLTIEPQKLSSESGSHVIHTDRLLTNIRALAIDDATTQKASWLTVLVAGDSITLNTTAHSQQADRSATVTLYLPNHGDAIDSTTISLPFTVSQSHNNIFDGASYHHRYVEWNQTGDTLKLTRELKDIKCQLTDTLTHKNPSWLSASIEGKNVVFKPVKLTAKTDRTVLVTLYMGTLNDQAVQTSFYVTQRHNNIFDGEPFHDRTVEWNLLKDTLKLTRELTDIKCDLADNATKQKPSWLSATVTGKDVIFTVQNNSSKQERTATVTLYLPNGSTIDANTIKTLFQFKQTGNTFFNGVKFDDQIALWNQSLTEVKANFDLRQVKSKLVDVATNKAPTWLSTSFDLDNSIIELKTSQLTTITDRTATVILYVPNGSIIDENTEQISFKLTQHHNNIFDGDPFHERHVGWDEKYDTLKLTRELTGIKCQLTDNATKQSPSWLQAAVKGKNVEFTVQNNKSKLERSATVTLYLPDGSTVETSTVKTSFQFRQNGNNIFNGVALNDTTMLWNQTSKVITTTLDMTGIQYKLTDDATGKAPTWLSITLEGKTVELKPTVLTSKEDRTATITLYVPNNGTTIDANTVQTSFKLTQHHNNIFDGEPFHDRTVQWDEKYDTLKLTRDITGFKCQLIDNETRQKPTWLSATINGKNVEFVVSSNNSSRQERSVTVTLYLQNGSTIDEHTIQTSFQFKQTGNNFFSGVTFENQSVLWNQLITNIPTTIDLKAIRSKVTDENNREPGWLKVSFDYIDNKIQLTTSQLNSATDRSATVMLYVPNGNEIDANTERISFTVKQFHNNIFDGGSFHDRQVGWDEKYDTLKLTRELTSIKCQLIDNVTKQSPSWLKATIKGQNVEFEAQNNSNKTERSATVTLYLPDGSSVDESTVKTSFQFKQSGNNIFSSVVLNDTTVAWNQTSKVITTTLDMTGIQSKLIDDATGKAPNWLSITLDGKSIELKPTVLTAKEDRTATITLYVPNNGTTIDANTVQKSFKLTQKHNNVFDNVTFNDRTMTWDQKYDTLRLTRDITGIKTQIIDNETSQNASWLTATVNGKNVEFTAQNNNSKKPRTATVTLYQQNGSTIDEHTIKTSFQVTQTGNNFFSGVTFENQSVLWNQLVTNIPTTIDLKAIKAKVTDENNREPNWLKVSFDYIDNRIQLMTNQLNSATDRTATVMLYVPNGNEIDANTERISFTVKQFHNNIFDGGSFHDRQVGWDEKYDTLKLTRELTSIKCQLIDNVTKQSPSWLKATIKGQNVEFEAQNNSNKTERSATVTLYLPDGSSVNESTVKTSFQFKQSGNIFFAGITIPDRVVSWNTNRTDTLFSVDLSAVSVNIIDETTQRKPDWISVTLEGKYMTIKPATLTGKENRSVRVTLYIPNNGSVIDGTTEQLSFRVEQHHNNIFDGVQFNNRQVNWDEKYDTLKLTRELTGIKCQLTDNETQKSPTWLTATIVGKHVEFTAQTNYSKYPRSASVVLYLPNGSSIDANTIQTAFAFTQKGNDLLDSLNISDRTVAWNLTSDKITTKVDMTNVRCQMIDNATQTAPTWLKVILKDNTIELQPSKLNTKQDRSATLTFFVNGATLNANTPQKSFKLTQKHNNIFDDTNIHNREVRFDQNADTLKMTRDLTDLSFILKDDITGKGPNWLSAKIEGKTVVFNLNTNTSVNSRSATVTLYLPNGYGYDENDGNTIKTSFKVVQGYEVKVLPNKKKVEVDYQAQKDTVMVTSNTKYQIHAPSWVNCVMVPTSETSEKLILTFNENTSNTVSEDTMYLTNAGEVIAKVALKQRTNPKIEVNFADNRKEISVTRGAAEIELPVRTLTPVYTIKKKGNWISVGEQRADNNFDQYYHKVKIGQFTGTGFIRRDTLKIYNDEFTYNFPIEQHKYIYMDKTAIELEVGQTYQLGYQKLSSISNAVTWRSEAEKYATVSPSGLVTAKAVEKGKEIDVRIYASLGKVGDVEDYNDYTIVTVYDVPDKINIGRGNGTYEKQDSLVTSDCPIVIKNEYHENIELDSVNIVDLKGKIVASIHDTLPTTLYKGSQETFSITPSLNELKWPRIKVVFTCNGKKYTKYVNY